MRSGRGDDSGARGPVFVGGTSRSGKTLVRWILSAHPRIAVSRRTEMWPRYYERFGDLGRSDNLERCLHAMLARTQIRALDVDVDGLRRDFLRGAPTYARLFALFHEQYAEGQGKARWGDQTVLIERFAQVILPVFPGAKFIHLMRDPRDRYAAMRERGDLPPGALGQATASWLYSAALARRNAERFAADYRVVRYEDLVTHPARTVRRLCEFLGEEFHPAMVELPAARRYDDQRAAAPDGIPISPAFVGQYRDQLGPPDLAFIQAFANRQMRAFGYPPDPSRLGYRQRLRCLVGAWPTSLARMGSWRVVTTMRARPNPLGSYRVEAR